MINKARKIVNSEQSKRIVSIVLSTILLFSVFLTAIPTLTDNTASARVSQGQIDRLRAEKREYERRKSEVQAKIDSLEFERLEEMAKKEVLDERITLTSLEIRKTTELITQFTYLIREKEYEVNLAQNREETQLYKYRSRVRDMEENGIISYLEIIFDSTSFADLLARIDFIGDIMRADEKTYIDLQNARDETELAKADLEETKEELDEEMAQLEVLEAELLVQLEEAHDIIRRLESDLDTEGQLYDQLEAEEARIQRELNAAVEQLRRQQEAERLRRIREQQAQQAAQQASNPASGNEGNEAGEAGESSAPSESAAPTAGGNFMWPLSGSFLSGWGASRAGGARRHQGIDIGAPHGASIVAADSGTVVTVSYGSGYGHYVTIAHGNGIQTLYSHLSSAAVSVGTHVSRGQVIGYVGSSGNATTPHLHFEVFVNGVRVNPMQFL